MPRPQITLDVSEYSVVVLCSECGTWRELANSRAQGLRLAQIHATFVHRDDQLAADFRARSGRLFGESLNRNNSGTEAY